MANLLSVGAVCLTVISIFLIMMYMTSMEGGFSHVQQAPCKCDDFVVSFSML